MTTLARHENNDIGTKTVTKYENGVQVTRSVFDISSGRKCYKDILEAAVMTVFGELQLDINRGIPYFATVFDSTRSVGMWQDSVRKTVSAFPFVRSIEKFVFDVDYENKILSYEMTVNTDEGSVVLER